MKGYLAGSFMNETLYKFFIKNYEDVKNPAVRESYGKLGGTIGVLSNLILSIIKICGGIISSSISIIADGINNLSDAASSIITLLGFKLASIPEDEDHPYGHARIEYLAGLIISMIIIFVGCALGKNSIYKVLNPSPLNISNYVIIMLVLSIFIKIWQANLNYSIGKKINSLTLKATATDSRNDVIATSMVLLSSIVAKFTNINLDGYLGIAIAVFIIYSGIILIKETASPLLGESPDTELVDEIISLVLSYDGVLGLHDLVVHNYGARRTFASLHIEVDADVDIMVSHDIVDNIEKEMRNKLHIHFIAHMDPIRINDPVIQKVYPPIEKCISQFQGLKDIHDLRCVPGKTHTNIIFDVSMDSSCTVNKKEVTSAVDKVLKSINPDYFVVITFDKAYTNL